MAASKQNYSSDSGDDFDVYCNACDKNFSGTIAYKNHLKGKDHEMAATKMLKDQGKAATKKFMKEKYGKKYLEELGKLNDSKPDESGHQLLAQSNALDSKEKPKQSVATNDDDEDDDVEILKCEVCQKLCTGRIPYELHLAGANHAKKVKQLKVKNQLKEMDALSVETADKAADSLYDIAPHIKPFAQCQMCHMAFSGPEGYKMHLESKGHKKSLRNQSVTENLKQNGVPPNSSEDQQYSCTDCQRSFSGPLPYQQHLLSKTHKKKTKLLELNKEMKHLMMVTKDDNDEDELLHQCLECGLSFYKPEQLVQHLQGPAHKKQKQKEDLINKLAAKHPEMVVSPMSDRDEAIDDGIQWEALLCGVCMTVFSGPESARDHFRSKAHLKAVKVKQRVQKLKASKNEHEDK